MCKAEWMRRRRGSNAPYIDGCSRRAGRRTFGTALAVAAVALAAAAAASPPDDAGDVIGYIRSVDGTAQTQSQHGQRPVESFTPVRLGDTIHVQSGMVVVCDMRTGESFEVRSGNTLSLPPTVTRPNPGLLKQLREAWKALTSPPKQDREAKVRDTPRPWPDQRSFALAVPIQFRWPDRGTAGSFDLTRLEPQPQVVFHADNSSSPMPWPSAVPRVPGRYRWEVHDAGGKRLASGLLRLMTEAESEARREDYMSQNAKEVDAEPRRLLAELFAAHGPYDSE